MPKPNTPAHERHRGRIAAAKDDGVAAEADAISQMAARSVRRALELEDTPQTWARIRSAILAGMADYYAGPEPRTGR
jgi:hypothetical protein